MSGHGFRVAPAALRSGAASTAAAAADLRGVQPAAPLDRVAAACAGGATSAAAAAAAARWQSALDFLSAAVEASADTLRGSADTYDSTDVAQAAAYAAILD